MIADFQNMSVWIESAVLFRLLLDIPYQCGGYFLHNAILQIFTSNITSSVIYLYEMKYLNAVKHE